MVHFCYIDESGVPQIPGNSSHYVLCGISLPLDFWKTSERQIEAIKTRYQLANKEVHTAWLMRKYFEQSTIPDFETLDHRNRISEVQKLRKKELLRLTKSNNSKSLKQTKKNYTKTNDYIHLTWQERVGLVQELADCIGKWGKARIFAECIDKVHFDPNRTYYSVDEQAFEQVVSRFEHFLNFQAGNTEDQEIYGALIHDNNHTVAKRHTQMMKEFHKKGTLWTSINRIIETPLFVDSQLTSLVQIADLCSYALRRFFENNETDLINRIKGRFDQRHNKVVGVRHFSDSSCNCLICDSRK